MSNPSRTRNLLFSPGIYEHAAALIGESACAVSREGDLLFHAQRTAWQRYRHFMLIAGIDVYNVEPEVLGAGLDSPPARNSWPPPWAKSTPGTWSANAPVGSGGTPIPTWRIAWNACGKIQP
jgi:hypothetical protein